jgi:hypothetical protein
MATQHGNHGLARSVVGTIEIASDDPRLDTADAALRAMFNASITRPLVTAQKDKK